LIEDAARERGSTRRICKARREFGDDTAVIGVQRGLRVERVSEQAALAVVKRDAGLVAGGFDA
jgi:hypothetical protein